MTAEIVYKADLRCEATHIQSGTVIQTDAPTDNRGKGESFSPTDLLCVSLGTCMITTIGIRAADMQIDLSGSRIEITKFMLADPRRVGKISITLHISAPGLDENYQQILQKIGDNCPVARSIHPDLQLEVTYDWKTSTTQK